MKTFVVLDSDDNVGVAVQQLPEGTEIAANVILAEAIPAGHKFSLCDMDAGESVIKYGVPIGTATTRIPAGKWVHVHNVKTNLSDEDSFEYHPITTSLPKPDDTVSFMGYRRASGEFGIRNEVWIIPTVGCVNWLAERLAAKGNSAKPQGVDRVVALTHPYGCSQLGQDHENVRTILCDLARHPNAAAIFFIGLGCENNVMADFRALVESHPDRCSHIAYMVAQEVKNELEVGCTILDDLIQSAGNAKREEVPIDKLCVGMKCGASDGLSGITANPLLGAFSDWLVARGGRVILTEVPEMFGAEDNLLNRSKTRDVFERGVAMIKNFKQYFLRYGQPVYENPSPGNKEGGITTLEDKSVGCTQKSGTAVVADILPYGGMATKSGVTLLSGPGNDLVSVSALTAAGAHMVLFSTGRGNPLGAPVPVIKVSSNRELARRKGHWIDFDASPIIERSDNSDLLDRFVSTVTTTASGSQTKSEKAGFHDFTIFKDGVTL